MKNYVQEGIVVTVIAPAAVVSGQLVKVGNIVGVAACDASSGEECEVRVEGVFSLPKGNAADVLAQGGTAGATFPAGTVAGTGGTPVGWIMENSTAGQTTVAVRLCPGMSGGAAVTAGRTQERSAEEDDDKPKRKAG